MQHINFSSPCDINFLGGDINIVNVHKLYYMGGQLYELREPHFRKKLRQDPCISKENYVYIHVLPPSVPRYLMDSGKSKIFDGSNISKLIYNETDRSLNSGTACCLSVQNTSILPSPLLLRNAHIKI
jgi:hypothetical protein